MSDSIIYADCKTKVTLSEDKVKFVTDGRYAQVITISRAAMNEIVRGFAREVRQEAELEAKP